MYHGYEPQAASAAMNQRGQHINGLTRPNIFSIIAGALKISPRARRREEGQAGCGELFDCLEKERVRGATRSKCFADAARGSWSPIAGVVRNAEGRLYLDMLTEDAYDKFNAVEAELTQESQFDIL